MRILPLLLLAACGVETEADRLAAEQLAPVAPGYSPFEVSSIVPGSPMRLTYADLTPGNTVFFGVSFREQPSALCPALLAGDCLDIGPGVVLIGSAVVDVEGYATFTPTVPNSINFGDALHFQAVELQSGSYVQKSDVFTRVAGPGICPAIFAPVCGVDGNTYGNDCESSSAGWPVESPGPC